MRSPFPGMDPHLEHRWGDVHTRLCTHISGALQPDLPRGLRARAQQDIKLEEPAGGGGDEDERAPWFEGDVTVVETGPAALRSAAGTAVATIKPVIVSQFPVLERSRWVQIIDTHDHNRVVTVIEILSPCNKLSGKLNEKHREKLKRYMEAGVSIVEIDLLRSSRARLNVSELDVPLNRRAAYYTCVNWAKDPFHWGVYPMPLRQPLPTLPVPCRETDADVSLALQPVIDRIYIEGGHDDIDYSRPPEPPLSPADAAWAAELTAGRTGEA